MFTSEVNIAASLNHRDEMNEFLVEQTGTPFKWGTTIHVGSLGSNDIEYWTQGNKGVMKLIRASGSLLTYRIFPDIWAIKEYIKDFQSGEPDPETGRRK